MSTPFSGKAVVIGRSSGPPGSGSLTIASANADGEASARVAAPAVLRTRRRDERKREGSRAMAVPPPVSDLVRMYLDGVSRNVDPPDTVAVNEPKTSEQGVFSACPLEPLPCHQPSARQVLK